MNKAVRGTTRGAKGKAAHKRGHMLEYIALFHLLIKGYHILGFRLKTPQGEIDILALKNNTLCVIEVKSRQSLEAGFDCVTLTQKQRLRRAADSILSKRQHLLTYGLRFDLYLIIKGRWPQHIKNGLSDF